MPTWTPLEPAFVLFDIDDSAMAPRGLDANVVIERAWGSPTITSDGVSIARARASRDPEDHEKVREMLRAVRIGVSPAADAILLKRRDDRFRYAKVEFGVNAVVPRGRSHK